MIPQLDKRLVEKLAMFPYVWDMAELFRIDELQRGHYRDENINLGALDLGDGHELSVYHQDSTIVSYSVVLEVFWPEDELPEDEWRTKLNEFEMIFDKTTQVAAIVLGKPEFSGYQHTVGHPKNDTSVLLSFWTLPSARIAVRFQCKDTESPMMITVSAFRLTKFAAR